MASVCVASCVALSRLQVYCVRWSPSHVRETNCLPTGAADGWLGARLMSMMRLLRASQPALVDAKSIKQCRSAAAIVCCVPARAKQHRQWLVVECSPARHRTNGPQVSSHVIKCSISDYWRISRPCNSSTRRPADIGECWSMSNSSLWQTHRRNCSAIISDVKATVKTTSRRACSCISIVNNELR